jgi:RNA polymerase sigma-70 factor (ECF subfamily)
MENADTPFVALLVAAKGGSREALGSLFDLARPDLRSFAERSVAADLRTKASGSDLVQDTLLEAQRLLARFDGTTPDQFRAWLRGVLANKVADFHRRYRRTEKRGVGRERKLSDDGGPLEESGPGSEVSQREQESIVTAAVAGLPAEYRDVIRLRTWDGLPFAEVGRLMGRSEDAARMLWGRAIERLREVLGGGRE